MYSKKQKRASRMMMRHRKAYRGVHFKNQTLSGPAAIPSRIKQVISVGNGSGFSSMIAGVLAALALRRNRGGGRSK